MTRGIVVGKRTDSKVHRYRSHGDHRAAGQTNYEFLHATACGFVRENVTTDDDAVTCKLCLHEIGTAA